LNSQSFLKIKVERMKEIVKRIEKLRIEWQDEKERIREDESDRIPFIDRLIKIIKTSQKKMHPDKQHHEGWKIKQLEKAKKWQSIEFRKHYGFKVWQSCGIHSWNEEVCQCNDILIDYYIEEQWEGIKSMNKDTNKNGDVASNNASLWVIWEEIQEKPEMWR
jgi:hypothetical protein